MDRKDAPPAALVLIALLPAISFAALYYFRQLDDNTLVPWGQALAGDPGSLFAALLLAGLVAYHMSRLSLSAPLALLPIAFLAGAAFWQETDVIIDASRYFTYAKHIGEYGLGAFLSGWGRDMEAWTDMPLVPAVHGLMFKLFGEGRTQVLALNTSCFALTVYLTAKLGEELFEDRALGLAAGGMMLAMPYSYTQVPLMLIDIYGMCGLALSMYLAVLLMKRGGLWLAVATGAALALTALVKYSMWLMLSSVFAVFALFAIKDRKSIPRTALALTVALAVFGAFALAYHDVMASQMRLLNEYQRPGLQRWGEGFASTLLFQIHILVPLFALLSLLLAWRRRDARYLAILWLPLLAGAMRIERIRYLMPAMPMLSLMAAYGLGLVSDARARRLVVVSAALASFTLAALGYLPFLKTNSLRNLALAGEYLNTLDAGEVRVITLPQRTLINPSVTVPLLDLYTNKRLVYDMEMAPTADDADIRVSPFRFTWTFDNPPYYAPGPSEPRVIAIIHPGDDGLNPDGFAPGYRLIKKYNVSENIYMFRPNVNIYGAKN